MIPEREFYFLRHGQTDWNVQRLAQGTSENGLNQTGLEEAANAADLLKGIEGIGAVVSSPLRRSLETAAIVAEALSLPVETEELFAECGFGVRQGKVFGDWLSDWFDGITPEGAEPYQAYVERSAIALSRALSRDGTALVVAHGGTYFAVHKYLLSSASRKPPTNSVPLRHTPPATIGGTWTVVPSPSSW